MRFSHSFIISIILHALLIALLVVGASLMPSVPLPIPQNNIDIISLRQEGGREGNPIPKKTKGTKPQSDNDDVPSETPQKAHEEPKVEPKKEEPKKVEDDTPKVIKDPEKAKIEPKKVEPKKEEPKKEEPKKEEPKKDQAKDKPKETEHKKADDDDVLKKALEHAKEKDKKNTGSKGIGGDKGLEDAISAAQNAVDTKDKSGGGKGKGEGRGEGDNVGIKAEYVTMIQGIIQSNWAYQGRGDRKNFRTVVNIRLDKTGKLIDAKIVSKSGDNMFDTSILKAIRASDGSFMTPPDGGALDMDIAFTDTGQISFSH